MADRLVILGSTHTALAVARVARRRGLDVILLDTVSGPARWTRMARFERLPRGRPGAVTERIAALVDSGARNLLVADSDRWLRFVAQQYHAIAQCGIRILHPRPERIRLCLDKSDFLGWCRDQGLPAPELFDPDRADQADAWTYPLLLRPRETLHSSPIRLPKACTAGSARELRAWLQRFRAAGVEATICESLLRPGVRQLSSGAARGADGSVQLFCAEKLRPPAERCAGGTFVRAIADPGIAELAGAALARLDYYGVAEVEILYQADTGDARLVEINARPWLQFGLSWACGVDLIGCVLADSGGRDPAASSRASWMHFRDDAYQCFSRSAGLYRLGRLRLRDYLRELVSVRSFALWDSGDPGPFFMRALSPQTRASPDPMTAHREDARDPAPPSGGKVP